MSGAGSAEHSVAVCVFNDFRSLRKHRKVTREAAPEQVNP